MNLSFIVSTVALRRRLLLLLLLLHEQARRPAWPERLSQPLVPCHHLIALVSIPCIADVGQSKQGLVMKGHQRATTLDRNQQLRGDGE